MIDHKPLQFSRRTVWERERLQAQVEKYARVIKKLRDKLNQLVQTQNERRTWLEISPYIRARSRKIPQRPNRNMLIFFAVVDKCKSYSQVAEQLKMSPHSIRTIVAMEARRRAPEMYQSINRNGYISLKDLRKHQDIFLYGDI